MAPARLVTGGVEVSSLDLVVEVAHRGPDGNDQRRVVVVSSDSQRAPWKWGRGKVEVHQSSVHHLVAPGIGVTERAAVDRGLGRPQFVGSLGGRQNSRPVARFD